MERSVYKKLSQTESWINFETQCYSNVALSDLICASLSGRKKKTMCVHMCI